MVKQSDGTARLASAGAIEAVGVVVKAEPPWTPDFSAIEALEALDLGAPWGAADALAAQALGELATRAALVCFPTEVTPAGADVVADFTFSTANARKQNFAEGLVALHHRAMRTYPALAALLRGPAVRDQVAEVGNVAEYEAAIAAQLVGVPEFEPWAGILAQEVPALMARLTAAREHHQAHAAAEIERAAREQAEADAVLERERKAFEAAQLEEAESHDRAAAASRATAARARFEQLARRVEKVKGILHVGHGAGYDPVELARGLRAGVPSAFADQIEAALAAAERAA